jgi:hypothetical protein
MPRHVPPITPRFPSAPAALPDGETHNVALQPAPDDPLARVRALARAPDRYITEPNPFTMALWSALNESAVDVLARHGQALRAAAEAHILPPDSDDPGERPVRPAALSPAVRAITAVTDAVVARAIQGDQRAADMIAARIEGNPGQRRGDIDPEAEAQRARVRGTIEQIVRDMADRAMRGGDALDVTPTPSGE